MTDNPNEFEKNKLAIELYLRHKQEIRINAFNGILEYGKFVVRTLLLINGGAIVVILALIGSVFSGQANELAQLVGDLEPSFYAYTVGILASLGAGAVGYFNFGWAYESHGSIVYDYHWSRKEPIPENVKMDETRLRRKIVISQKLAVALCFLSAIAFLVGSYLVIQAFAS